MSRTTPPLPQLQQPHTTTLYDRPALDQGRASALVLDATCAYYRLPPGGPYRPRAGQPRRDRRAPSRRLPARHGSARLADGGGARAGRPRPFHRRLVAYYLACVTRDLAAVPAARAAVEAIREEVAIRTGQRDNVTWLGARD